MSKSVTMPTSTNGSSNENQKKEVVEKVKKEPNSSPTTPNRLENASNIKSERLSVSPEKQPSDRRSNGTSLKPNSSKSKLINGK